MRAIKILLTICFVLNFTVMAFALTVEEIVNRSNQVAYYKGHDGSARVAMAITDSQGRERNRKFSILRWDDPGKDKNDESYCGDQKYYVYFHLPADVNKMVFTVWKHVKSDDDRWLYLPALDLVKRISSTEKRTSFVGSDFFYEDVSGRNINDDVHELVKEDKTFFILKNIPKDPDKVEFSYYTAWVHKKTFLSIKVEYFDRKREKYREYEALKVDNIQGYPTVTEARMKDLRTGSETVLKYTNVKYNIALPEKIFTERYLRRPPTKYLR
jgi:Outer membrane lipoprotein-sorting protein